MGLGWTSSIASPRLAFTTYLFAAPSTYRREADVTLPNGKYYPFLENPDGSFLPPSGRYDQLIRNADGTWDMLIQRSLTLYHFDSTGALISITDDYGNIQNWSYDGSGRVQKVTDVLSGRYINVFYGGDGRVSSLQDSGGRQVQYGYNAAGNLTSVTDVLTHVTTYTYTQKRFAPLLTKIQDNWGRTISDITYDAVDRTTSYTDAGESYTYTYNSSGQTAKNYGLNANGNPWLYGTDGVGLISSIAAPSGSGGGTKSTVFDGNGNPQLVADEVGVKTFYTYDGEGSVTSITRDYQGPSDARFDYTYDPAFPMRVASITPRDPTTNQIDPTWQGWKYDYYQAGDPAPSALHHVSRVENDGTTLDLIVTYTYDTHGRLLSQTSATGGQTDYAYDAQGNLHTVTAPSNNDAGQRPVTTYGYDALGRVTTVTDALSHMTTYTYDPLDRVLTTTLPKPSTTSPLVFTTTYSYDNFDSPSGLTFTNMTDANQIVTKQGDDQFGRLVKSIDGLGATTSYIYSHGLLSSVTDANSNVTSYFYDALRRLSSTTFPEGTSEGYTYYADGQLHTKTDRKGQTITYAYDHFTRLATKSYPNSSSLTNTYMGQLLTQVYDTSTSPAETHTFQYDPSYRVITNVQATRGTLSYQYNPDDTVLSLSVQGGATTAYTYYPTGAVNTIAWTPISGVFKYTYTLDGHYQSITTPNGQSRNYSYDDQGRLLQVANTHPSAGNLATFVYGYDLNNVTGQYTRLGQRVSMTASVPSQGLVGALTQYSYDSGYQLTQATYPNAAPFNSEVDSWTYDAIGNRVTSTLNGNMRAATYLKNGANPLNGQRLAGDGANAYTYDANGSTTTMTGPGRNLTFTWSAGGRLMSISGDAPANFAYDYKGRRVAAAEGSSSASFLYSGTRLVATLNTAPPVDYLYGSGVDEALAVVVGSTASYSVLDGQGSIVGWGDGAGNVPSTATYDAWGVVRGTSALPAQWLAGYTGREPSVAGLQYSRYRFLLPSTGRFLSEDPLGASEDTNVFRYVHNDPVDFMDPSGLQMTVWPPQPDLPAPQGCTVTPWRPVTSDHVKWDRTLWKKTDKSFEVGFPVKQKNASIVLPVCKCIWSMAGAVEYTRTRYTFERDVKCPPCGGEYTQAMSVWDRNLGHRPIPAFIPDPPPTIETSGVFDQAQGACLHCQDPNLQNLP
jgi:RHS repeat-associated protein